MSRRRRRPEEHQNHEAWSIPYGDLITLLLAFFVVMYAISSVNAGKYRILSDSLSAAFRGEPRTFEPVPLGDHRLVAQPGNRESDAAAQQVTVQPPIAPPLSDAAREELQQVASQVENAMQDLIAKDLVVVRRHDQWVEVEIRTDILFSSGLATLQGPLVSVLGQLADTPKGFPNPIRVEGHTDNLPIRKGQFPSNWELSAARAASVVHLFTEHGVAPSRLSVIGLGEFRPAQPNTSPAGRNANRRVVLVILGGNNISEGVYAAERGKP